MVGQNTRLALASNIRMLMVANAWDQNELAKRSGVSQKTISNMLNPQTGISPKIENVERVAQAFRVSAWNLITPDITVEMMKNKSLSHLLGLFTAMSLDSQNIVTRIAEHESNYKKK